MVHQSMNNNISIASYSETETNRLKSLAELPLSYQELEEEFQEIVNIAYKVTGAKVAAINILDTCMQWSVATKGIKFDHVYRDESVCQFTILEDQPFEVKNLTQDDRFKKKFYVKDPPNLKYYYGIPFKGNHRQTLGTLCILDTKEDALSRESKDILQHLAIEMESKIKSYIEKQELIDAVRENNKRIRIVAHDIRNPISSVVITCQLLEQDSTLSDDNKELISMMREQSESLISYSEEILNNENKNSPTQKFTQNYTTLKAIKKELNNLYTLFANRKSHNFSIVIEHTSADYKLNLSKNVIIQIAGNLLANAIKFTPSGGRIFCSLSVTKAEKGTDQLHIVVEDNGVGIDKDSITAILEGEKAPMESQSHSEKGYGIGLKHILNQMQELNGSIDVTSEPKKFTRFEVMLPC